MNYYTYWSVSELPSNTKSFDVFFWIAIVSFVLWILIKRFKKKNDDYEKMILLWSVGAIFSLSIIVFFYLKLYTTDTTEKRIQNLFKSPNVMVVEGKISNFESFSPASRRGWVTIERFRVDSINFQYEDALLGRFNTFTKTNNGIFKNGLNVRITYGKMRHEILKIEIAKKT
ncbi:putative PurR-regulated permease PerM [Flavobacterium nitrogenifigens]|uniref:PurR-regulated permease PerM n=2 Tax=Flavobacterium TaxID=237 RepID=A0ABR6Q8V8_9FLAO|nr:MULTISPECIES: hypothetical protein [Flavobacterium]MBB4800616.1 putative PurR-regulated permease PerM [Flavobacterium nitrogenifigens]MBB6385637.1 putative PurR-regulated permease PerM [Flavobacterium notoginsengisoli]